MRYKLALRTGGLMEDPEWHYNKIIVIEAGNLRDAKSRYAELTNLVHDPDWNEKKQTLWGWAIVDMFDENATKPDLFDDGEPYKTDELYNADPEFCPQPLCSRCTCVRSRWRS